MGYSLKVETLRAITAMSVSRACAMLDAGQNAAEEIGYAADAIGQLAEIEPPKTLRCPVPAW